MKKVSHFLMAAGALMALTAPTAGAETFSPGGRWNNPGSVDDGTSIIIANPSEAKSASQTIFSVDELTALVPTNDKIASISAVSFNVAILEPCGCEGQATYKAYLSEYDDATFPSVGGKLQWLPYAEALAYGEGVLPGEELADDNDYDYTVTITFDNPIEYHGESLVLTLLCESDIVESYGMDWFGGMYSVNPNKNVSRTRSGITNSHNLTGNLAGTSSSIPVVNFTYTLVDKPAEAPSETYGDPTTFEVGWDKAKTGCESSGWRLPFDNDFEYGFSQMLYTAEDLQGLRTANANGITSADIESLTFKYLFGDMYTGQTKFTVYIQNVSETGFPIVNTKKQWFAVDKTIKGELLTEEYEYTYLYGEDVEFKIDFEHPLRYAGESLLVTFVSEGKIEGMNPVVPQAYVFNASGIQSAIKCADSALGILSGEASNTSKELLALKLGIVPVTTTSATKPVMIENATAGIAKVDIDNTLATLGKVSEANNLYVTFDVVDATNGGSYDIYVSNNKIGTLNGTHGVINFLGEPTGNLVIGIAPAGGKVADGGSMTTIAADVLNALLPAPTVTATDNALYASYSIHNANKCTLEAYASFQFDTNVPVTLMRGTPTDQQTKVITSSMSWDLKDKFPEYLPTGEYNDYAANNGRISYYKTNFQEVAVKRGHLDTPSSKNMTIGFTANYPLLVKGTPMLTAELFKDQVATATDYSIKEAKRDYNNGSSYASGRNQVTSKFDVANGTELKVAYQHPEKFTYVHDKKNKTLDFFAPAGYAIHYVFYPETPAEEVAMTLADDDADKTEVHNWTETSDPIYNHDIANGRLVVKAVDADGNELTEGYSFNPETGKNDEGVKTFDFTVLNDSNDIVHTGIDNIEADGGEVRYYNLQGLQLGNRPATGVYIEVKGAKATKRVVR